MKVEIESIVIYSLGTPIQRRARQTHHPLAPNYRSKQRVAKDDNRMTIQSLLNESMIRTRLPEDTSAVQDQNKINF